MVFYTDITIWMATQYPITHSAAIILSDVPDILHVQQQFFESDLEFSKGKIHFFQKC